MRARIEGVKLSLNSLLAEFVFPTDSLEVLTLDPLGGHCFFYFHPNSGAPQAEIRVEQLDKDHFQVTLKTLKSDPVSWVHSAHGEVLESGELTDLPTFWWPPVFRKKGLELRLTFFSGRLQVVRRARWRGTRVWEEKAAWARYDAANGVLVGHSALGVLGKTSKSMKLPKLARRG